MDKNKTTWFICDGAIQQALHLIPWKVRNTSVLIGLTDTGGSGIWSNTWNSNRQSSRSGNAIFLRVVQFL